MLGMRKRRGIVAQFHSVDNAVKMYFLRPLLLDRPPHTYTSTQTKLTFM